MVTDRQGYYVSSRSGGGGWVAFVREGTIMAQRFDPVRLELSGTPAPIAGPVGSLPLASYARFSVSDTGVLVYSAAESVAQLTWFNTQGNRTGVVGEPGRT